MTAIRKFRAEFEQYLRGGARTTQPLDLVGAH
jgi:hypothetical protein